ncbi:hypothetical protein H1R20_g12117, partial [Candolleomyces eurysporus]
MLVEADSAVVIRFGVIAFQLLPWLALASAAFFHLVNQSRKELEALTSKAQEREAKDEATIGELRRQVETLESELRSAKTQNRSSMEKEKKYMAASIAAKEAIQALSKTKSRSRRLLSDVRAQHAAKITELKSSNAELLLKAQEVQAEAKTAIIGLKNRMEELELTVRARDEQVAFLAQTRETLTMEVARRKEEVSERDRKIEDLKDRLAECLLQLDTPPWTLFTLPKFKFSIRPEEVGPSRTAFSEVWLPDRHRHSQPLLGVRNST